MIAGERVTASNGATLLDLDPSTGEVLAEIASAGPEDVDRAVAAAREALGGPWGRLPPAERGRILNRIAERLRQRIDELAVLESQDNGKPLRQSRTDITVAARYFEFYGGAADKIFGTTIPIGPGFVDYTLREPIGVSAQIVPWNYPIQIGSRGVAPALAAGCSVVLKPSSAAPLTAIRLGEIALECGLPAGVLNVIPGSGQTAGRALAGHPGIDQLTFTGSVDVGVEIATLAARNIVPVVLELGGKSPNIVFADADLDQAALGVANAIFQNAGQTCSAGSRLLVDVKAHDALLERLVARARGLVLGPGVEDPDMGPLISSDQRGIAQRYISMAREDGARVVTGGAPPKDERLAHGSFLEPTIIDGVDPASRVAQDEIFGPVLAVITFSTIEEAAALADQSRYGLVAGVWTKNIDTAMRL
ncbi:MAG TPA: aldehyde dehydrogenase family protein, partial [Candidatus Limnocylindrales bacterium]|nr:aldehyde dehydrogenase family protein [Candidatus Limnocylindrales bacterium]